MQDSATSFHISKSYIYATVIKSASGASEKKIHSIIQLRGKPVVNWLMIEAWNVKNVNLPARLTIPSCIAMNCPRTVNPLMAEVGVVAVAEVEAGGEEGEEAEVEVEAGGEGAVVASRRRLPFMLDMLLVVMINMMKVITMLMTVPVMMVNSITVDQEEM